MGGPLLTAERLLEHEAFLRRLARGLAGDPYEAEEVVQETFLAALRRPAPALRSVRAWLACILRNLVRDRWRARERRLRREEAAARAEATPSVADILSRESVRQRVVRAVVALPEPHRAVVLLRYYEGLSSTQIGRRLGRPAGTVRRQLGEAVERLRRELDARHGGRREEWLGAVAVIGAEPGLRTSGPFLAGQGVLAMSAKAMVSAVAVCVVVAAGAFVALGPARWHPPSQAVTAVPPGVEGPAEREDGPLAQDPKVGTEREEVAWKGRSSAQDVVAWAREESAELAPERLPTIWQVGELLRGPLDPLIEALDLPPDVEARVRTPEGRAVLDEERQRVLQRMDQLMHAHGDRTREIVAEYLREGRPLPPSRPRSLEGYSRYATIPDSDWQSESIDTSIPHSEYPELANFLLSMRRLPGDLRAAILRRFAPDAPRSR